MLLKIYRDTNVKKSAGTPNLAQDNQAIKRQKLEGGRTRQVNYFSAQLLLFPWSAQLLLFPWFVIILKRSFLFFIKFQILNVKPQHLPHKTKLGLTSSTSNLCSSTTNKTNKEDRKVCPSNSGKIVSVFPTSRSLTHFDSFLIVRFMYGNQQNHLFQWQK